MHPVVLIMIDGMRPDALLAAQTPRMDAFMAGGAYTLKARSVMPSVTLPCHTSIFHSVPPTRHGITDNDWHPMARPVPGLIEVAKKADKSCSFFYNWEPLRDLNRPYNNTFTFFYDTTTDFPRGDGITAEAFAHYMPEYKFDFSFVYFGNTDNAGHEYGWMEEGYIKQIELTDAWVGLVLDTVLPMGGTVILHADHGGHDRGHGTDSPEDMTIPWMIGGAGVKKGHIIERPVSLLDTAPTIAHLMSIPQPSVWEGTAVTQALEA